MLTDREGRVTQRIGRPQFMLQDPSVSPDGKTVAGVSREQGQFAVWLHETDSGQARRVTFDVPSSLNSASWTPDGRYLYFNSDSVLWKLDVQGDEAPSTVADGWYRPLISSDGRYLVYQNQSVGGPQSDIFYLDLQSDSSPEAFLDGQAGERTPRISPNVRYIAIRLR